MKEKSLIKSLEIRNFKSFEKLDKTNLGEITYLVGKNNSGKSSFVKALILTFNYFNLKKVFDFKFDTNKNQISSFLSFERALNKKSKTNTIIFILGIGDYDIAISIEDEPKAIHSKVSKFDIVNQVTKRSFTITAQDIIMTRSDHESSLKSVELRRNEMFETEKVMREIEAITEKSKTDKGYDNHPKLDLLLKDLSEIELKYAKLKDVMYSGTYFVHVPTNLVSKHADYNFSDVVNHACQRFEQEFTLKYKELLEYDCDRESTEDERASAMLFQTFMNDSEDLKLDFERLFKLITYENIHYIESSYNIQSSLFRINDIGNPLAQSINEFAQFKIVIGSEPYVFIRKWMKIFDVGVDFTFALIANEAYTFEIYTDAERQEKISIADFGLGTVKIMTLLLKIGSMIFLQLENKLKVTLIIEEPELNLHPNLQSQLTQLFWEVNQEYGFRFIIETHSEYMIRKAQVLTVLNKSQIESEGNENPFKIIYFENESEPYEININPNGQFTRPFGSGFYDESAAMTTILLKEMRKEQMS